MIQQVIASLLLSTSLAYAQDAKTSSTSFIDNISVEESFSMVNYKDGTLPNSGINLFQFVQGVNYNISDSLVASLDIPVYSAGTTDLGAIGLDLTWNAYRSEIVELALSVGVETPMNTAYGASSVDPTLGGIVTFTLPWSSKFVQTANYEFVTNDAYSLAFGSKVTQDILTAQSSFVHSFNKDIDIGVNVWQNYTVDSNGQQNILVGPDIKWNITNDVNLDVGVQIPVYQNVIASAEQNYTLTAGFGIKF